VTLCLAAVGRRHARARGARRKDNFFFFKLIYYWCLFFCENLTPIPYPWFLG
jgi:hypothetical protein